MPPTYDTSTGLRALTGSNVVADVDAGFLALAQDVAAMVAAAVAAVEPVGTIKATARTTAPTGFLLCDGAAVSRTTYASLFTAIGTTYGAGNGSTTFNLPDLRGRVPVGVDGAAARLATNDALGQAGGEENHTLTIAEMPSHDHDMNYVFSTGPNPGPFSIGPSAGAFEPTVRVSPTGGGGAHNTMQPYQVVNWMVKT